MVSLLSAVDKYMLFSIIMHAAKFNANVSSNPKISAESRDDISKLYIVNRFYNRGCTQARGQWAGSISDFCSTRRVKEQLYYSYNAKYAALALACVIMII